MPPAVFSIGKGLIGEPRIADARGIGGGEDGDATVHFRSIEKEHRTRQALRGIAEMLRHAPQRWA